ncbi:MAG: FHA domain-containing protein [Anaerolineae bacterium]
MAYGRLDVFWPDGLFKTYLLSDSNISMGRSSGNTIPLETDTLSRYHATLVYKDGEVQITDLDSANGTFVDGVRLKANEPRTLYGGEEFLIGELRMVYHFLDESPTRPITIPEEITRRIELEEAPFYIEIEPPEIGIPPGAHISARVSITNPAAESERFRVEVSGVPKDWARIDRPDLEIAPEQHADVIINFKPRRRSDSAPGDYVVQIAVYPKSKPELKLKGSVMLTVLPYGGFGMALERDRMKSGERFRLHLHNQGSAPLPINLIARDLSDSLTFAIPNSHLTLAPGQHTVIQGQAKPRTTHFFGDAREHRFDLIARSAMRRRSPSPSGCTWTSVPPLPSWTAFAFVGVAAIVVITILIGLAVLLQPAPPQPAINSFQVNATRLARGEPPLANWSVTNADDVRLTVNGAAVTRSSRTRRASRSTPRRCTAGHGRAERRQRQPPDRGKRDRAGFRADHDQLFHCRPAADGAVRRPDDDAELERARRGQHRDYGTGELHQRAARPSLRRHGERDGGRHPARTALADADGAERRHDRPAAADD